MICSLFSHYTYLIGFHPSFSRASSFSASSCYGLDSCSAASNPNLQGWNSVRAGSLFKRKRDRRRGWNQYPILSLLKRTRNCKRRRKQEENVSISIHANVDEGLEFFRCPEPPYLFLCVYVGEGMCVCVCWSQGLCEKMRRSGPLFRPFSPPQAVSLLVDQLLSPEYAHVQSRTIDGFRALAFRSLTLESLQSLARSLVAQQQQRGDISPLLSPLPVCNSTRVLSSESILSPPRTTLLSLSGWVSLWNAWKILEREKSWNAHIPACLFLPSSSFLLLFLLCMLSCNMSLTHAILEILERERQNLFVLLYQL